MFCIKNDKTQNVVELNPAFRDYTLRSENVDKVLREFREENVFVTLKGWRDEVCLMIFFSFQIKIILFPFEN